ncbi:uncharacterized protein BDCG_17669, partial [Blastomyces dermatitidis ER-3]
ISQLCDLFLIRLVFCIHSHKETFTILHHSFTNFSHSSIIFFISLSLNVTILFKIPISSSIQLLSSVSLSHCMCFWQWLPVLITSIIIVLIPGSSLA